MLHCQQQSRAVCVRVSRDDGLQGVMNADTRDERKQEACALRNQQRSRRQRGSLLTEKRLTYLHMPEGTCRGVREEGGDWPLSPNCSRASKARSARGCQWRCVTQDDVVTFPRALSRTTAYVLRRPKRESESVERFIRPRVAASRGRCCGTSHLIPSPSRGSGRSNPSRITSRAHHA